MGSQHMFVNNDGVVLINFTKTFHLKVLLKGSMGCHKTITEFLRGLPEFVAGCVRFDCILSIYFFKIKIR